MRLVAPPRPRTSRSLLAEARHVVLPERIVSSGWPAVRETCRKIGILFDPWQQELNQGILAKGADGLYAADTVAISICRQSGKTYDIGGLVFADSLINPGTTTVWTAHRFKVARETFDALRAVARSPLLAPHIEYDDITTGAGNEVIPFRNGSRIVFAARERGAIRGFSKVRRLILDEGQILTESAMADLVPTMNQATNPQVILMGTPPKPSDPGEVFSTLRAESLADASEGVLYVEFSAAEDCDIDDRKAWAQANPSYPLRTPTKAILRLRKLLANDDDFRREALGIWDSDHKPDVFGAGRWKACAGPMPADVRPGALAVAVSYDLRKAAIVAAAVDGTLMHVRPLQHGPGTGWVAEVAKGLQGEFDVPVAVDPRGPASDLVPELEAAGVRLYQFTTGDVLDACAAIFKRVQERALRHESYRELDAAVAGAVKRPVGDRWAWGRKQSSSDISTLEGAALAAWTASTVKPKRRSCYEDRGLEVVG